MDNSKHQRNYLRAQKKKSKKGLSLLLGARVGILWRSQGFKNVPTSGGEVAFAKKKNLMANQLGGTFGRKVKEKVKAGKEWAGHDMVERGSH